MMSASAAPAMALDGNVLRVTGTGGSDQINLTLSHTGKGLTTVVNGQYLGTEYLGHVAAIEVDAGEGNNRVVVDSRVRQNVTVATGGGHDYVRTAAGHDRVAAGNGNDTVVGGAGHDFIETNAGRDWADGGSGDDTLSVGSGHDTVSAGHGDDSVYARDGHDTVYAQVADRVDAGGGRNAVRITGNGSAKSATPTGAPRVTAVAVVDADTGRNVPGLDNLPDGGTLDLAKLPARFSLSAGVDGNAASVRFELDGGAPRVDNGAPHTITAAPDGKLGAWAPTLGTHRLAVVPFSLADAKGERGAPRLITFTVVNTAGTAPTTPTTNTTTGPSADPEPTAPTAGAPAVAIALISQAVPAGQSVHVDGTATQLKAGGGGHEDARFVWDFGDPDAKHNVLPGFSSAHVYEKPGAYTVKLTVTDQLGRSATATRTVTVTAPAGATYYVDPAAGNDAWAGVAQAKPVRTVARALQLAGDDSRVLLKRGATHLVAQQLTLTRDNFTLGAYGSGEKPTLMWAGPRAANKTMVFVDFAASNVAVRDLRFDTPFGADTDKEGVPDAVALAGVGASVLDNTFLNVNTAVLTNMNPTGVLVRGNRAPLADGVRSYAVWAQGSQLTLVANEVANSTREHAVRVRWATKVSLVGNALANLDRRPEGDVWDFAKGALTTQDSTHVYVADNAFRGPSSIGPLGEGDGLTSKASRVRVVAWEGNRTEGHGTRVTHGAEHVTLRDNVVRADDRSAYSVDGYNAQYGRGVVDLAFVHNTVVNGGATGNFVLVGGRADGISLRHNLYVAPNLVPGPYGTAAVYVADTDLRSFGTIDGNVWPSNSPHGFAAGGVHFVGLSYETVGFLDAAEWNSLQQVGTDLFDDVALDGDDWARSGAALTAGSRRAVAA